MKRNLNTSRKTEMKQNQNVKKDIRSKDEHNGSVTVAINGIQRIVCTKPNVRLPLK